jgi:DNA polymerase V
MDQNPIKFLGYVQAGFPSPASDYSEDRIDLLHMLKSKPSTFLMEATGDSMIEAHIPEGAILVIDKALQAKNNSIVVAYVNGEFTVKYLVKDIKGGMLIPANPKFKPIRITEEMQFQVFGVVTAIVIPIVKQ